MNPTKLSLLAAGMLIGTLAHAQLDVPVSSVSLEYPGVSTVALHILGTNETVIPTPFQIAGLTQSQAWLCMDPLQRIYYGNGMGSTVIHYASTNPSDFDIWNPGSPGLTAPRVQDLADLFSAHWSPFGNDALTSGALQLAVWEITNEFSVNSFNLSNGAFSASDNSAMITLAQSFLDGLALPSVHNQGNVGALSFLIDGSLNPGGTLVQDLVGWNPTLSPLTPVPEPSTYGLSAAFGLVCVAALRRRRARRA